MVHFGNLDEGGNMTHITAELRASLENSPYARLLGFRLLELAEGYAKVSVTLRPEHASFLGATDGSLIMSLADYASACAGRTFEQVRVAVQSSTNFISSSAIKGNLWAEAKTIHAGKTLVLTEMTVTDDNGRIIARAASTGITRPERSPATK